MASAASGPPAECGAEGDVLAAPSETPSFWETNLVHNPGGGAPKAAAGGPFTAGQRVEYRSSGGGWIPAVVQEVHPDGSYKLDCKPRAPADAVRAVAASPRAPAPVSLAFQAEEMVEYFSASQKEWMKARVLAANADGTYDLDCKAGVPESKLRKMLAPTPREASRSAASPRPAAAKFQVGEMVEYFSASQKDWMRAKVTAVRADGMYDLDCKPGVSEDKLRKAGSAPSSAPGSPGTVVGGLGSPGTASPGTVVGGLGTGADGAELGLVPGASYKAGQMVEYFSASQQAWLKAKVLRVHTNGTYDLDCKAGVDAGKIRPLGPPSPGPPTGALRAAGVGSPGTLPGGLGTVTAAALAAGSSSPPPGGGAFGPGQFVEYFSASQQAWMRAKVTALNADGTFNLDCKPNVTQDKIRPLPSVSTQSVVRAAAGAQAGAAEAMYKAGQTLEYFSASLQGYMKAKVLRANPDGTYDLDCKAGVPEGKLRGLTAMQERDEVASVASMASSAARVASMQERDKLARVASTASADGGFGEDPANRASLEEAGAASAGDHRLNWPAARSPFEEDAAGQQSVMMRRKSSQPARSEDDGGDLGRRGSVSDATFLVGELVEYFNPLRKDWEQTKVLATNADGTYDLECKTSVPASRMRAVAAALGVAEEGEEHSPDVGLEREAGGRGAATCEEFTVGQVVEYHSITAREWLKATVRRANEDGTYEVDGESSVAPRRMRVPQGLGSEDEVVAFSRLQSEVGAALEGGAAEAKVAGEAVFVAGEDVECLQDGEWRQAKVLDANPQGTYDTDHELDVPADRLRKTAAFGGGGEPPRDECAGPARPPGPAQPAASSPSRERPAEDPRSPRARPPLEAQRDSWWVADSSRLGAGDAAGAFEHGLPFCNSESIDDASSDPTDILHWGRLVQGRARPSGGWLQVGGRYLPMKAGAGREAPVLHREDCLWVAESSGLHPSAASSCPGGLAYCRSESPQDKCEDGRVLEWGHAVTGRLTPNGRWLQVGDRFAPVHVGDVQVLHCQTEDTAWRASEERLQNRRKRPGVPYCRSEDISSASDDVLHWGEVARGRVVPSGRFLKVDDRFLPLFLGDCPALMPVPADDAPRSGAGRGDPRQKQHGMGDKAGAPQLAPQQPLLSPRGSPRPSLRPGMRLTVVPPAEDVAAGRAKATVLELGQSGAEDDTLDTRRVERVSVDDALAMSHQVSMADPNFGAASTQASGETVAAATAACTAATVLASGGASQAATAAAGAEAVETEAAPPRSPRSPGKPAAGERMAQRIRAASPAASPRGAAPGPAPPALAVPTESQPVLTNATVQAPEELDAAPPRSPERAAPAERAAPGAAPVAARAAGQVPDAAPPRSPERPAPRSPRPDAAPPPGSPEGPAPRSPERPAPAERAAHGAAALAASAAGKIREAGEHLAQKLRAASPAASPRARPAAAPPALPLPTEPQPLHTGTTVQAGDASEAHEAFCPQEAPEDALAQFYVGSLSHPAFGRERATMSLQLVAPRQGCWTSLGQAKDITVHRSGRGIVFQETLGITSFDGVLGQAGAIEGVVSQRGDRAGTFSIRPVDSDEAPPAPPLAWQQLPQQQPAAAPGPPAEPIALPSEPVAMAEWPRQAPPSEPVGRLSWPQPAARAEQWEPAGRSPGAAQAAAAPRAPPPAQPRALAEEPTAREPTVVDHRSPSPRAAAPPRAREASAPPAAFREPVAQEPVVVGHRSPSPRAAAQQVSPAPPRVREAIAAPLTVLAGQEPVAEPVVVALNGALAQDDVRPTFGGGRSPRTPVCEWEEGPRERPRASDEEQRKQESQQQQQQEQQLRVTRQQLQQLEQQMQLLQERQRHWQELLGQSALPQQKQQGQQQLQMVLHQQQQLQHKMQVLHEMLQQQQSRQQQQLVRSSASRSPSPCSTPAMSAALLQDRHRQQMLALQQQHQQQHRQLLQQQQMLLVPLWQRQQQQQDLAQKQCYQQQQLAEQQRRQFQAQTPPAPQAQTPAGWSARAPSRSPEPAAPQTPTGAYPASEAQVTSPGRRRPTDLSLTEPVVSRRGSMLVPPSRGISDVSRSQSPRCSVPRAQSYRLVPAEGGPGAWERLEPPSLAARDRPSEPVAPQALAPGAPPAPVPGGAEGPPPTPDQRLAEALAAWEAWAQGSARREHEGAADALCRLLDGLPLPPLLRTTKTMVASTGEKLRGTILAAREEAARLQLQGTLQRGRSPQGQGAGESELTLGLRDQLEQVKRQFEAFRKSSGRELDDARAQNRELGGKAEQLLSDLEVARTMSQKQGVMEMHRANMKAEIAEMRNQSCRNCVFLEERVGQLRRQLDEDSKSLNLVRCELERAANARLRAVQEERKVDLQQMQDALGVAEQDLRQKDLDLQQAKAQLEAAVRELEGSRSRNQNGLLQRDAREATLETELREERSRHEVASAARRDAEAERLQLERAMRASQRESRVAATETKRLGVELEQARKWSDGLAEERDALRLENERLRREQQRLAAECDQQLKDAKSKHSDELNRQRSRMLESEKGAGEAEGRLQALAHENQLLRAALQEAQAHQARAGSSCTSGIQDAMRRRLEKTQSDDSRR